MNFYTSYFAREKTLTDAGLVTIGISIWPPKFYRGMHYPKLAPKAYMMKREITDEEYTVMYRRDVLGRLRPEVVVREIEELTRGRDAALLCFEKPGDFCHRRLVAQWLTEETGLVVDEWMTPAERMMAQRKAEEEARQKQAAMEPTLF